MALSEVTRYLDLPRWHDRAGHASLDTDDSAGGGAPMQMTGWSRKR